MSDTRDRETLADALLGRICNVSNLPDWMQVPALGRSMRPLANTIADAALASDWLADHDRRVQAEALREARDDIRDRIRVFRDLNADPEYLNALNDAWGLVANRERADRIEKQEGR